MSLLITPGKVGQTVLIICQIGLLMFCIILVAYWLFLRDWINVINVQNKLQQISNINQLIFQISGVYFIVLGSASADYLFYTKFYPAKLRKVNHG